MKITESQLRHLVRAMLLDEGIMDRLRRRSGVKKDLPGLDLMAMSYSDLKRELQNTTNEEERERIKAAMADLKTRHSR